MLALQKGLNPAYPDKIKYWKFNSNTPAPSWITDNVMISGLKESGEPILTIRGLYPNGFELLKPPGVEGLVKLTSEEDYLCISSTGGKIFSLTEIVFDLIYKKD